MKKNSFIDRAYQDAEKRHNRRITVYVLVIVILLALLFSVWYLEYLPRKSSAIKGTILKMEYLEEELSAEMTIRTEGLFSRDEVFRIDLNTTVLSYAGESVSVLELKEGYRVSVKVDCYVDDVRSAWLVRVIGFPNGD